jgi:hypothetical protein
MTVGGLKQERVGLGWQAVNRPVVAGHPCEDQERRRFLPAAARREEDTAVGGQYLVFREGLVELVGSDHHPLPPGCPFLSPFHAGERLGVLDIEPEPVGLDRLQGRFVEADALGRIAVGQHQDRGARASVGHRVTGTIEPRGTRPAFDDRLVQVILLVAGERQPVGPGRCAERQGGQDTEGDPATHRV